MLNQRAEALQIALAQGLFGIQQVEHDHGAQGIGTQRTEHAGLARIDPSHLHQAAQEGLESPQLLADDRRCRATTAHWQLADARTQVGKHHQGIGMGTHRQCFKRGNFLGQGLANTGVARIAKAREFGVGKAQCRK